jgi:hypothetical protein
VIDESGRRWWPSREACERLGVGRTRLGDWVRRSKAAGHVAGAGPDGCRACGVARFPHVDPPRRSGAYAIYLAEQLMEAEAYTSASHRGGASRRVT